jgi:hypothetical protein
LGHHELDHHAIRRRDRLFPASFLRPARQRRSVPGDANAPRVDGVTNPPTLNPNASGVFSLTGAGFQRSANTSITLGGVALGYSSAASPSAGQFTVDAAGANIQFVASAALPAGNYPVLLAVSGIAATTGWVAVVA